MTLEEARRASLLDQGFTSDEAKVIVLGESMLQSPEFSRFRSNVAEGLASEAVFDDCRVVFVPTLPGLYSGMTLFGEQGFVVGAAAFRSESELYQTVMHELYRLSFSTILPTRGATVGGAQAHETGAAAEFAARALNAR